MSKKYNLRFSVTDGNKKASTWSIVSFKKKPEVYIFNRLLGSIHVSFHGSGKWHIKFNDIEEKRRVSLVQPVEDAYMTKWERPDPIKPSVTVALRIITPWGALQKSKFLETKDFVSVPNAAAGNATEILVLIIAAGTQLDVKNAEVIGSVPVANGEQVVVASVQIPATRRQATVPPTIPDISERVSLLSLLRGNKGIIFFGDASDGSRVLWEYALQITPKGYLKIAKNKLHRFIRSYRNLS